MLGKTKAGILGRVLEDDPLSMMIAPPANENPEAKQARLAAEVEAKRISDAIDEEINRQRIADKKEKAVKILLLGQSESGKSTTLKNLQLMNSPKHFKSERPSWRAVIQLNVVRSIRLILDCLTEVQASQTPLPNSPTPTNARMATSPTPGSRTPSPPMSRYPKLTPDHIKLKMRLSPLLQIEDVLLRRLNPNGVPSSGWEATSLSSLTNLPYGDRQKPKEKEVTVNSSSQWKGAFSKLLPNNRASTDTSSEALEWDDPQDPGLVLSACADDMKALWYDPVVQRVLKIHKLRLEEMAGFFLDSIDRVTKARYIPTDDDILRARLKTVGRAEHTVEGIRRRWATVLAAWVPYFDSVDAIIFLAPISCFDQVLAEDDTVNRLEDSVLLWKNICQNPLLKNTAIVLFLNKCDILKVKLEAGIRLSDYILSYGDRPNDFESTAFYLKRKFAAIQKEFSPEPRIFYCHFTAVTDTRQTFLILSNVQDMLLRANLKQISLID